MSRALCPAGELVVTWLKEHDHSQQWLVEQLTEMMRVLRADGAAEIGRAVLWRWLVGETTPQLDFAAAIEKVTGVPAAMWANDETLRPETQKTGTEG